MQTFIVTIPRSWSRMGHGGGVVTMCRREGEKEGLRSNTSASRRPWPWQVSKIVKINKVAWIVLWYCDDSRQANTPSEAYWMAGEPRATPRTQSRSELSLRRIVHFRAGEFEARLYSASYVVLLGRRPMSTYCFLLQFSLHRYRCLFQTAPGIRMSTVSRFSQMTTGMGWVLLVGMYCREPA